MRVTAWETALIGALVTACSAETRPKVVEIESILTSDAQTRLFRFELEYDGSRVEEVYISADGETTAHSIPTYTEDRVTRVEVFDLDGEPQHTSIIEYDGSGNVVKVQRGEAGEDSRLRTFDYQDDAIQTITYSDTRTNPLTGEREETAWTESFRYNKDNRIDRITLEGLGDPQIQTLSWGGDGTLKGISLDIGGATLSDTFSYDDQQRLERINSSDLRRYEVRYGGHGYVSEVESTLDDEIVTTRYYYGDGNVAGLVPSPDVPGDMFFHLRGQTVENLSFNRLELLR